MSYDVSVNGKDFNITSNLAKFFKDFDVYPPDWDGKHRLDVAAQIRAGLLRINQCDRVELGRTYDAGNGWGKATDAIDFLEHVLRTAGPKPNDMVRVSW